MRSILAILLLLACVCPANALPFERELDLPNSYKNERVSRMIGIPAGETFTFLDVDGPGAITHIWMTLGPNNPRDVILRMYWDGEDDPSVEAPISDFFGVGHNRLEPEEYFATPCLVVAPHNGYNIYMPMPFRSHAKITVTNEQDEILGTGGGMYFQADYVRYETLDERVPYFHAQWRREAPASRRGQPYTVLQAVGSGFIAGMTYHLRADDTSDEWVHGGGDLIYIDGDSAPNLLKGIGGEDFAGESWQSWPFTSPYAGVTNSKHREISMYRFFLESPPRFETSVRFAFGALENEISSVVYWYQNEQHTRYVTLPDSQARMPQTPLPPGQFDIELLPEAQFALAILGPFYGDIATKTPLDGAGDIDFKRSISTNYTRPFANVIPQQTRTSLTWERRGTILSWLDFDDSFRPKMEGIRGVQSMPDTFAFAYSRIFAEEAGAVELLVGYDDGLKAWLNGDSIAEFEGGDGFRDATITLDLKQGRNDLLLKVANTWNRNWAAFAISLHLKNRDGLRIDALNELLPGQGPPAP